MFGFGNAHHGKTVAVADIGGGSAGVAIVSIPKSGPSRVESLARSILPIESRSPEARAALVMGLLKEASEKAVASYAKNANATSSPQFEGAYAIIRAPWIRTKTARAESVLKEETLVSSAMISKLATEALQSDTDLDHARILEASIVRVKLNGYPTARPERKYAHQIDASMLLSECHPWIRFSVEETLRKTFSCRAPALRSGTRAIMTVLRESGILTKDSLVVNMTSGATNLITVRKGVVSEVEHVLEGSWTIVQRIAGSKMPEEVFSLIRLWAEDRCEREACASIQKSMAEVEPELVKIFGEAFSKMATIRRLPNTLILLVPEDLEEWLAKFFSRIDFSQFTLTTQPFTTNVSTMKTLSNMLSYREGVVPDPGLAVASALVNIEAHSRT